MRGRARRIVLALATTCFVATASGGALCLHLGHDEDVAEHDSDHCSICQHLLLSKKHFTIDPEPAGIGLERVGRIPAVRQETPILTVSLSRIAPRAPPA